MLNENELEGMKLTNEEMEKVSGGYIYVSPNDRLCPRCGEYKAFISKLFYEDPSKSYSKICCTACGYEGIC